MALLFPLRVQRRTSGPFRRVSTEFLVRGTRYEELVLEYGRGQEKRAMGVESLRRRSTQLLGNMYRLEIVEAINSAAGEPITATSVHEETGIRYPRVQEELKRLAEAGLLLQRDAPRGQPVEYKASESVYWEMCERLLAEARTDSD